MDTVRYAKLVGIICIAAVLSAMYSGVLAVIIMLFAALPVALICRKKMNQEQDSVQKLLSEKEAVCAFKGDCFEGFENLSKTQESVLFFTARGISICYGKEEIKLPYRKIKEMRIYTFAQILEIAGSGRRVSLGKLGEAMSLNTGGQKPNMKLNQQVRYLILRIENQPGRFSYISFSAPAEYADFNRMASLHQKPEKYVEQQIHKGKKK